MSNAVSRKILSVVAAATFMSLGACAANGASAPAGNGHLTEAQRSAISRLESQQKIADQAVQAYRLMDTPTLVQKLAEQSAKKRETFNSLAYWELKGRKDVDSQALVALVRKSPNADGLLPLLLLRKLDERNYLAVPVETRAAVLTDALATSQQFNAWGLPHAYLEEASRAMLETGRSAYPALKRMLSDTRPAPVYGSKEYMEYVRYKYKLCDYALFFLERLDGNARFVMPVAVSDRDALIKNMMK